MGEAWSEQIPRAPHPLPQAALQVKSSQSGWGLGTHCLPMWGACLALPCLCLGTRRGVRLEDSSPFQALVERGFVTL